MKTNWPVVFVVWFAGLCAAGQFAKIGVVFAEMQGIWPDAGARLGLIVSVVGAVGVIFGTTAGLVVARLGARRLLLGGLLVAGTLSGVQIFALTIEAMIATRLLEGFAHLSIVVAGPVVIAQACTPHDQPAGMALWSTFFGLAFTVMALFGLPLVQGYGVRALWAAHGAACWLAAAGLAGTMGTVAAPAPMPRRSVQALLWDHIRIYRSPFLAAPALGFVFYTLIYVAVLTLVPGLVDPDHRALMAAGMPIISIVVSLGLGVWLMRRIPAVQVIQAGFMGAGIGAIIWAIAPGLGHIAGGFLLAACLGLVQSASFASIPQLNATAGERAQASGAVAQLGNVGTTLGTPILLVLIHWAGAQAVTIFVVPLCLAGFAMHLWQSARRARALAAQA
ncbi:MFS transporter [Thioclava sp. SK-1]|uniref:MFS transporter n=1 Tax=Thioclava sp. SK-1 TaxID=1889770 RepID=UPI0009F605D7|nr:MFS transporter [Thioclava sp. SK-1]